MFQFVPTSPPLERPPSLHLPTHKLTIYELDRAVPLALGTNPRKLAELDMKHEAAIPHREAAVHVLVKRHTMRDPIEINHTPGGDVTAHVLKG